MLIIAQAIVGALALFFAFMCGHALNDEDQTAFFFSGGVAFLLYLVAIIL